MKRTALALTALALLLTLSSCASTMPGAGDDCNFCKVVEAIAHRNVTLSTTRIEGIGNGGKPVATALLDDQQPGLGALLNLAIQSKQITASGFLLKVKFQKREGEIEVVCSGKWADECEALKPSTPAIFYVTEIPIAVAGQAGTGPIYLLRDLND